MSPSYNTVSDEGVDRCLTIDFVRHLVDLARTVQQTDEIRQLELIRAKLGLIRSIVAF